MAAQVGLMASRTWGTARPVTRPSGDTGMRGRDSEWWMVTDLLRRTRDGSGGVLLVEGERGMGKSLLLREAGHEGTRQGFSLAIGAADQIGRQLPLFALRRAVELTRDGDDQPEPESPAAQIGRLRERLARRTETAPVLVVLDDLQWASQQTLLALRVLPRELARYPVIWILARSVTPGDASWGGGAEGLFNALEREGASRAVLRPLDTAIVTEMLAHAFGAPPDDGLLELALGAGGNPSLLADLVTGLREDKAVRLAGGRASLGSARLPGRISRAARQWLDVSGPTRRLLETAAVLGGVFRLTDAAEVMGTAPTALLPDLQEALDAGIIDAGEETFSFRCHLMVRAAAESIPPPVRRVLHRRFGEILLSREGSAEEAAGHLLDGASPSDRASLRGLDHGVVRVLCSSPRTAADLAVRALRFTGPADQAAVPRAVAAAEALAAAGQPAQAARIAYETLARPVPAPLEARLRSALASILNMSGQASDASAQADKVLDAPDAPDTRDHAITAWLQAAAARGHDQYPDRVAADVLAAADEHAGHVILAARTARAALMWDEGRIIEALELLREAARRGGVSPDARHSQPLLLLAARLIDLRQLDEAASLVQAAEDGAPDGGLATIILPVLRARLHVAGGRFDSADAEAASALEAAESAGADAYASVARCLLASIALRQGRLHDADRHIAARAVPSPHAAAVYAPAETCLTPAQVAAAAKGPSAAIGHVLELCAHPGALRRVLLGDPARAVWLVRAALAAGDHALATRIVAVIETLASPDVTAIGAAAAHARGLLTGDGGSLAYAAAHHSDPWARARAAEDLADLNEARGIRDEAVLRLNQAFEGYAQTGATADSARVRSHLRDLGVRRRHWKTCPGRPVDGWESLTGTERAVSELIAQGLTNRQAASRMYISTHTVAHHLRQAFRKLSIGSRIELARIVMERSQQA